jgi:hypothetical protein
LFCIKLLYFSFVDVQTVVWLGFDTQKKAGRFKLYSIYGFWFNTLSEKEKPNGGNDDNVKDKG